MKIALITGANRGIGFEAARQLGKRDFHILVGARDRTKGQKAVDDLHNEGCPAELLTLDTSDDTSIRQAALHVQNQVGALDVLVNNAGNVFDGNADTLHTTADVIRQSFELNTIGPVLTAQAFWSLLLQSDDARIINVSSTMGSLHHMGTFLPTYSASKTALNAFTVQLAKLGEGKISVNAVCPGWVRTELGGANAPRSVEQGAAIITKLATMDSPPTGKFLDDAGEVAW